MKFAAKGRVVGDSKGTFAAKDQIVGDQNEHLPAMINDRIVRSESLFGGDQN